MTVYTWEQLLSGSINADGGSALTIGGFDGPHRGHMELFQSVLSRENHKKGVITFSYSPRAVKEAQSFNGNISSLRLRLQILERLGFDFAVVIDFSREFGRIKGTDFLRILYDCAHMRFLTVGAGFRCGYRQDAGEKEITAFASANGVVFCLAPPLCDETGERISSSRIRANLAAGNMAQAARLLGFDYRLDISGVIWSGQSGAFVCDRTEITQIIPPVGQYAVYIETAAAVMPNVKLCVEEKYLRCFFPSDVFADGMQTLVFGYQQD